jgi:hypothetical protein
MKEGKTFYYPLHCYACCIMCRDPPNCPSPLSLIFKGMQRMQGIIVKLRACHFLAKGGSPDFHSLPTSFWNGNRQGTDFRVATFSFPTMDWEKVNAMTSQTCMAFKT